MADTPIRMTTVRKDGLYYNVPFERGSDGRQDDRIALEKAMKTNSFGSGYKTIEEASVARGEAPLVPYGDYSKGAKRPPKPTGGVRTADAAQLPPVNLPAVPAPSVRPSATPVVTPPPPQKVALTPAGTVPLEKDVEQRSKALVDMAKAEGIDLRITSNRTTGRAFDVAIYTNGKPDPKSPAWARVGEMGEKAGLNWVSGKSNPGTPYFEGKTPSTTQAPPAAPSTTAPVSALLPDIDKSAKEFQALAAKEGIDLKITSGYRTKEEQDALHAAGRTPTKGGESQHNLGRAIDVKPFRNGKPVDDPATWQKLKTLGEQVGFEWGGDFVTPDRPHFFRKDPVRTAEVLNEKITKVRSYEPFINKSADKYGVPRLLGLALMLQESAGDPTARSDPKEIATADKRPAMGLLQLIPSTWEAMGGGNPDDPETNIDHGMKYLGKQLAEFKTMEAALAAYHQGEGMTRQTGGKPAGPRTRHFVQSVMANMARFGITESSQQGGAPSTPTRTLSETTRSLLETQDPRLPMIYQALRVFGKTPEEFATRLRDPAFVSQAYNAALRHAETIDPKLTKASGVDAYFSALRNAPGPDGLTGMGKPPPAAAPTKAEGDRTWLPQNLSDVGDIGVQVAAGIGIDVPAGAIGLVFDSASLMGRAQKKFHDYIKGATGVDLSYLGGADLVTGAIQKWAGTSNPGDTVKKWAETFIDKPHTTTSMVARGAAGFLAPFLKIKSVLKVATGLGAAGSKWYSKAALLGLSSAAVTALQDPTGSAVDPNDPLVTVAIENFVRTYYADNPAQGRGDISRYIDGYMPEDELLRRFAMRGFKAGEDVALGALFDMTIGFLRMVFKGRAAQKAGLAQPTDPNGPGGGGGGGDADGGGPSNPLSQPATPETATPIDARRAADAAAQKAYESRLGAGVPGDPVYDAIQRGQTAPPPLPPDPLSDLAKDLEIRRQVREADDLAAELNQLRGSEPFPETSAPGSAFEVDRAARNAPGRQASYTSADMLLAQHSDLVLQGKMILEALNIDPTAPSFRSAANEWLQRRSPNENVELSKLRSDLTQKLSGGSKIAPFSQRSATRADAIQRLVDAGMEPRVAEEYLDTLSGSSKATPEVTDPPTKIKAVEEVIDRVVEPKGDIDIPEYQSDPAFSKAANRRHGTTYRKLAEALKNLDQFPREPDVIAEARKLIERVPGEPAQVDELRDILRTALNYAGDADVKAVIGEGGLLPDVSRGSTSGPVDPRSGASKLPSVATTRAVRDILKQLRVRNAGDTTPSPAAVAAPQTPATTAAKAVDTAPEVLPPPETPSPVTPDPTPTTATTGASGPVSGRGTYDHIWEVLQQGGTLGGEPLFGRALKAALARGLFKTKEEMVAVAKALDSSIQTAKRSGTSQSGAVTDTLDQLQSKSAPTDEVVDPTPGGTTDLEFKEYENWLKSVHGLTDSEFEEWMRPIREMTDAEFEEWLKTTDDLGGEAGISPEGLLPGVSKLPLEQVESIASDLVDQGGGALKSMVDKLKDAGLDTLGTKAIVTALLRGAGAGVVANELIDPTSSEAAEAGEPDKSSKVLTVVIAAVLGVSVFKGRAIARKLVGDLSAMESSTAGVKTVKTSVSPDFAVRPGVKTSRVEAFEKLTPEELTDPDVLFNKTTPRFDLVADPTDWAELKANTAAMFDGAPDKARRALLNTPLNSANELAEAIGANPKELQALVDRTNADRLYSSDMKAVLYLSLKAKEQLRDLATLWYNTPREVNPTDLNREIMKMHGLYGDLATGLGKAASDFGRGLNVMRQASDGRLLTMMYDGINAGDVITNPETMDRYMAQLMHLLQQPGGKAAEQARRMVRPTFSGAISQAYLHSLLGTVQTAANTMWSGAWRLLLNPVFRGVGAAAQKYGPDVFGEYKPGLSPEPMEFVTMLGVTAKEFATGVRLATNTLLTGDTLFLEKGASMGAIEHQSQFVREAFGPIPKVVDAVGSLVGIPNAGNMFNYIGSFLEIMGTRGLVAVDEFTQFMVERTELAAHALRASKDPNLNFRNLEEAQAWMRDFQQNPPANVIDEIKYQKKAASYMQSLFDERGAFQGLRRATGHVENAIRAWPIARVVAPFLRTAANVLQAIGEVTPGLSLLNSELRSANPWIRAEAHGRMITGMAAASAFAVAGAYGHMRGTLTRNAAYRSELEKAGVPENSVDWGGRTWKINPREPIGFLMTMFGQLGAIASGETVHDDEIGAAGVAYTALLNMLKDGTVVGAIAEFMHDIDDKTLQRKIEKLGLVGASIDTIDDILLKPMIPPRQFQDLSLATDGQRRVFDTYWEKIKARTPWLSDTLDPETDLFDRNRWAGSGLSADTVNNALKIITGVSQDKITQDPLSLKLIAKQIHIPDPRPTMEYKGISISMSKAEQQQLRKMISHPPGAAKSLYQAIMDLTNHPQWERLSPGTDGLAQDAVMDIVQKYNAFSRRYMLARSEDMKNRMREARKQKNLPITP